MNIKPDDKLAIVIGARYSKRAIGTIVEIVEFVPRGTRC